MDRYIFMEESHFTNAEINSVIGLLEDGAKEVMLQCRAHCMPQVDVLIAAGWKFELPEIVNRKDGEPPHMETEPWQWYWRRPARRKGSKGMKFWSTTMAFNALQKQKS